MSIDQRLAELGIALPQPAAPVAAYVPAVEKSGLLHISGQISFAEDGSLIKETELYISEIIGHMILTGSSFQAKRAHNYRDWGTVHDWRHELVGAPITHNVHAGR